MPHVLPDKVYTAAQVRELDALLIAAGTPGIALKHCGWPLVVAGQMIGV